MIRSDSDTTSDMRFNGDDSQTISLTGELISDTDDTFSFNEKSSHIKIITKREEILNNIISPSIQSMEDGSLFYSAVESALREKNIHCINILEITSERYETPIEKFTTNNVDLRKKIKSNPSSEAATKRDVSSIETAASLIKDIDKVKECFDAFYDGIDYQLTSLKEQVVNLEKNLDYDPSIFEAPLKDYKNIYTNVATVAIKSIVRRIDQISKTIQNRIDEDNGVTVTKGSIKKLASALNVVPEYIENSVLSTRINTKSVSIYPQLLESAKKAMNLSVKNFRKRYNYFGYCCSTFQCPDSYKTWAAFEASFLTGSYRFMYNPLVFVNGQLSPISPLQNEPGILQLNSDNTTSTDSAEITKEII